MAPEAGQNAYLLALSERTFDNLESVYVGDVVLDGLIRRRLGLSLGWVDAVGCRVGGSFGRRVGGRRGVAPGRVSVASSTHNGHSWFRLTSGRMA